MQLLFFAGYIYIFLRSQLYVRTGIIIVLIRKKNITMMIYSAKKTIKWWWWCQYAPKVHIYTRGKTKKKVENLIATLSTWYICQIILIFTMSTISMRVRLAFSAQEYWIHWDSVTCLVLYNFCTRDSISMGLVLLCTGPKPFPFYARQGHGIIN